ncbi:sugar phosphate isomerase/epimerase family protein [Elusimicrobiota bacterium]
MNYFLAMSSFGLSKSAIEVVNWAIEKGFKGIEIWAEVPFCHVDEVDKKTLEKLRSVNRDIKYTVHSPIYDVNICSVNEGIMNESIRQIEKITSWTEYFSIKNLIVHPGRTASLISQAKERAKDNLYKSLRYLKKAAEDRNINLLVENIGFSKMDYDLDIKDFKSIITDLDLGMCMDTGHANIKWGIENTVNELRSSIRQIHMSDNHGEKDQHLPAGEGNIKWQDLIGLITDPDIIKVHEIWDLKDPEEAILKGVKNLEDIINNCST